MCIRDSNKVLRQKLEALARDRPEDCKLVKVSRSGRAVDYTLSLIHI